MLDMTPNNVNFAVFLQKGSLQYRSDPNPKLGRRTIALAALNYVQVSHLKLPIFFFLVVLIY
jgi:hypothetical protein